MYPVGFPLVRRSVTITPAANSLATRRRACWFFNAVGSTPAQKSNVRRRDLYTQPQPHRHATVSAVDHGMEIRWKATGNIQCSQGQAPRRDTKGEDLRSSLPSLPAITASSHQTNREAPRLGTCQHAASATLHRHTATVSPPHLAHTHRPNSGAAKSHRAHHPPQGAKASHFGCMGALANGFGDRAQEEARGSDPAPVIFRRHHHLAATPPMRSCSSPHPHARYITYRPHSTLSRVGKLANQSRLPYTCGCESGRLAHEFLAWSSAAWLGSGFTDGIL